MKILAIMQNQWFKDPERARVSVARMEERGLRNQWIARMLFAGCLTGKRLRATFGELCDQIVWEEASREIGGESSANFKPDANHIADAIRTHSPDVVLTFGRNAQRGVDMALPKLGNLRYVKVINCPHPAMRFDRVMRELRDRCAELLQLKGTP